MNYIKDVALYNDDGTVNVVVEICPGTSDKNELVTPNFDRLSCVRKVEGVYPFYYGSFPQTLAGDKDPLDFIMFTDKQHKNLDLVKVDVIGAIKTVDAGEQDDKVLCIETSSKIMNARKYLRSAMKFLKSYKGKNADMQIDKKLASRQEAEELIKQANQDYVKYNSAPISSTVKKSTAPTVKRTSRVKIIQRG